MSIGEKIRNLRLERGLTHKDLAKFANTSFQTIYKYENDIITNIPLDKIELIAAALEVKPAELLGWNGGRETNGDVMALRERLRRQPGMRTLLSATEDATEEEIRQYANLIKALRRDSYDDT